MATEMQPAPCHRSDVRAPRGRANRPLLWAVGCAAAALASSAHASFLEGKALDDAADVIAWVALVIGPVVAIAVFWMAHIIPEKVAHKREHPQTEAIHMLCLLSLFFGGLLWPFALLWAVSRPVFYKMAYGADRSHVVDTIDHPGAMDAPGATVAPARPVAEPPAAVVVEAVGDGEPLPRGV